MIAGARFDRGVAAREDEDASCKRRFPRDGPAASFAHLSALRSAPIPLTDTLAVALPSPRGEDDMKQAIPFILPAMLMAFGSVQAQTAPAQQPAQSSQQAPKQAPAPTPASAEQTASCGGAVNKALTAMDKGGFNGATQSFDPNGKPTSDKLQQAWGALKQQYDKGQMVQGYTVVLVPMQFDKGKVGAEAACGVNGQLVVLRFGLMPNAAGSKS